MKWIAFLLVVGLIVAPFTGRAQPVMKRLLQHLDARPSVFKKLATTELMFGYGQTSLIEGGLIGEDEFKKADLTLVKSYGYYALRETRDRALRKRLGLTRRRGQYSWRDSSWNIRRERDWTGITLSIASDSMARVFLLEVEELGAREFEPCLKTRRINEVAVEEKTYALDNRYIIVFRKYLYPEGASYEFRLSLCSSDEASG